MATTYSDSHTDIPHYDVRAAAGVSDALLAVGRVVLVIMFVLSGIEKFMDLSATAGSIEAKGLPAPQLLAIATA